MPSTKKSAPKKSAPKKKAAPSEPPTKELKARLVTLEKENLELKQALAYYQRRQKAAGRV